jgi:hypothetical protein
MVEIKAEVDPFPFVPAIWMRLRRFKSDGCERQRQRFSHLHISKQVPRQGNHLISNPPAPFNHLRNSLLVHRPPGLPNRIHNRKIRLQRVKRRDGILVKIVSKACTSSIEYLAGQWDSNLVGALSHCGTTRKEPELTVRERSAELPKPWHGGLEG